MRRLLWIDCTAGLVVGVLVLALAPWLSALYALVVANGAWAALCIVAAVVLASRITVIGTTTLVFEGLFVGTLAVLEWRHRELLANGTQRT